MKKVGVMLGVALLALAHPALAQERLFEGLRIARACAGDIERICAGVVPGGGRIKACVKEKLSQLTPSCIETIDSYRCRVCLPAQPAL
jgi:hypothetical protein